MWTNIWDKLQALPPFAFNVLLIAAAILTGLLFKFVAARLTKIYSKKQQDYTFFQSFIRRLNTPLAIFLPLVIINIMVQSLHLDPRPLNIVDKVVGVLLIASFAWVLIALIKMGEDFVHFRLNIGETDNLKARKIRTQLQFIRQLAVVLIVILAIGAILLSFNNLRKLGTGLLTGVGISGIIIGFAAQRSIANLLAGFQIAFTQPIRIDDVLVVEGEWGRVEEINLTYVVVACWDQRRLILPINYFIEKPFQNWTRNSAELIGSVYLYLDYNAPMDAIRTEFMRLLEGSDKWDRRASNVQVTNTTDRIIEVRLIMTAATSGEAFELRCMVREKLLGYINKHYPECLPKTRALAVMEKSETLTLTENNGQGQKAGS